MNYLPGLALAPPPRHASLRRPSVVPDKRRPTEGRAPAEAQRAAANVTGLSVGVVLLDHHARQLKGFSKMPHATATTLGRLVNLSDDVVAKMGRDFDGADADSVNALSGVIGQAVELLLQLRVPQIEAGLKFLHEMASSNLK